MPYIHPSTYKSPKILFNSHIQTIYPALFRKIELEPSIRERIETVDLDFLDLDWYTNNNDRLVILSHGLEGDSGRPYIKGMINAFCKNSWDCLAWNFRGCSGEINRNLRFYHSGATDDLHEVIEHCLSKKDYKDIVLIGFSLGGNITLKYLGEQGNNIQKKIKKAITFSVPLDLHTSCEKISEPSQFIYSRRFLRNLKLKVKEKHLIMPEKLDLMQIDSIKTIKDFDDHYTAPLHGFRDAMHYYQECSSINFIEKVKIPTLVVNAKNDPFLSKECYPVDLSRKHDYLFFENPNEGGHCGFALFNNNNLYWSELRALKFAGE
jgi:uncharacterized protein